MSDLGRFVETFMDTHLHRMSFQKCLGGEEEKFSFASGTVAAAEFFHQVVSLHFLEKGGITHCLALAKLFFIAAK